MWVRLPRVAAAAVNRMQIPNLHPNLHPVAIVRGQALKGVIVDQHTLMLKQLVGQMANNAHNNKILNVTMVKDVTLYPMQPVPPRARAPTLMT